MPIFQTALCYDTALFDKDIPWINPFTSTQTAHAKAIPAQAAGGCLWRYGTHEKELFGGEAETTNNRMELTAVIEGLKSLKRAAKSSSAPTRNTSKTAWKAGYTAGKKNGWKTAAKKPVKNDDLWKELDSLVQQHNVRWTWVKGHAGHPENEKADELANQGAAKFA